MEFNQVIISSEITKINEEQIDGGHDQGFGENGSRQSCVGEYVEVPCSAYIKLEPETVEQPEDEDGNLEYNTNAEMTSNEVINSNPTDTLQTKIKEEPIDEDQIFTETGNGQPMEPPSSAALDFMGQLQLQPTKRPAPVKTNNLNGIINNVKISNIPTIQNHIRHTTRPILNLAASILHRNMTESASMIHTSSVDVAAAVSAAVVAATAQSASITSIPGTMTMPPHIRPPDYFVCMICAEGIPDAEALKSHDCLSKYSTLGLQRPPGPPKNFSCKLCDKAFSHHSSLKRHETVHKNEFATMIQAEAQLSNSTSPGIPIPTATVSRKRRASNSNNYGLYACSFCPASFHTPTKKAKHESTIHERERKYTCPICSVEFPSSLSFKFHVEKDHVVGFDGEVSASASAVSENSNNNGEFLEWAQAQIQFGANSKTRNLKFWPGKGQGTSSGSTPESGLDGLSRDAADVSTDQALNPQDSPDDQVELNMEAFMAPQVEIKEEPAWTCETCQRAFPDYTQLQQHSASLCGLIPASEIPKPNLHSCHICPEIFRTHYDLMKHLGIHSHLKPFQCPDCPSKFARLQCLTRHSRSHEGAHPEQKGPNSFVCPYCKEDYPQQAILTKHMLIHTGERPYECSFCQARFRLTSHLNRHVLLHTGQKSFACRFCPEKFTQSISLQCHERKHTGERPFACRYCPSRFRLSAHCKRHEQAHEAKGEAEILLSLREEMMKDEQNLSEAGMAFVGSAMMEHVNLNNGVQIPGSPN